MEPRRIADLDAPQYTTATLAIGVSRKITDCAVEFDRVKTDGTTATNQVEGSGRAPTRFRAKLDEAGTTATVDLPMVRNETFRILFYTPSTEFSVKPPLRPSDDAHAGETLPSQSYVGSVYIDGEQANRDPRQNRMTVRPDQPPTADLTIPATDPTAKPGEAIPVKFRLRDDHAIKAAKLLMRI